MAGKSFLAIRLSSLGDIIHALPAVCTLAQSAPEVAVDWMVEARYSVLLRGNGILRRLIEVDTLGTREKLWSPRGMASLMRSLSVLRQERYDAVIDFQGLLKSAILARCARAGELVGFAEKWLREPIAESFYTLPVRPHQARHVIEMNLALVEPWGAKTTGWQFPLPDYPDAREGMEKKLRAAEMQEFLIVNPGGGWAAKRWAAEKYAELLDRLSQSSELPAVVTYGPGEEPLAQRVLEQTHRARVICFPTDIPQFMALARRAKLFVGTDTGPLHICTALGIPVVGIYGPTDPTRNGPFSPLDVALHNASVISHTRRGRPTDTIAGISVVQVLRAVQKRLASVDA